MSAEPQYPPHVDDEFYIVTSLIGGCRRVGDEWILPDGKTLPSQEEIDAKRKELRDAEPMRLLRQERDRRIAETDWMSFSDSPTMTDEWKTYRQALRDLPSTAEPQLNENGQLTNVTWPTKPT